MTQYPPEVQKRRMQQLAVAAVARQCLQETSRRAARTVEGRAGAYFHMFLFLSKILKIQTVCFQNSNWHTFELL